jgi:hypothetical protein
MSLRLLAVVFLLAEAVGASIWWCVLLAWPQHRRAFLPNGAPDSMLLAFMLPDLALFIGAAIAVAYGLWTESSWAWPLLAVHVGAAGYAALYGWGLVVLTGGEGLLGAAFMSPSLVVPGLLLWSLRPRGLKPC